MPRLNRSLRHRRGAVGGGRAIIQEIREYTDGHYQADDITLVCFGPLGT